MSNKKSLGFILVVLAFILIALTGIRTISNPDIFTHIALGQANGVNADPLSYTMIGEKWIALSPLYDNTVAVLWSIGGAGLITLVHVAALLTALLLMLQLGKSWGGPLSQSIALLICSWMLIPVFNPSPTVFAMLFIALFVTLLYKVKNFNLLAGTLIVLQILWTNIHPSFLFGPVLILLYAYESAQESQGPRGAKAPLMTGRLIGLAVAALAASCVNPNFLSLHSHVLKNISLLTGSHSGEWISLFSGSFDQKIIVSLSIFCLVLGAGGLITLQKKLPVILTVLALCGAFLTVRSISSLLSFSVLSLPFLILSLSAVSEYLTRTMTTVLKANAAALYKIVSILALLLIIITIGSVITNAAYTNIGSASQFGLGTEESAFPAAASEILAREDFPEKILNIPHDGGYIAALNPNIKIFCDTRVPFYTPDFYNNLNKALLGQTESWRLILSEWNPEAIVMNGAWINSGVFANRMIRTRNQEGIHQWKLVYFDGATFILVRNRPEYASLFEDTSIQQKGLDILEKSQRNYIDQNRGFFKPGNPSRLIGAAEFFLAMNRIDEAENLYKTLTQYCPNMSQAWLGLGQSMILRKQLSGGVELMEKAASITPRSSRTWLALYQAYRLQGNEVKMAEAGDQLNKFFKPDQATVEQKKKMDKESSKKTPKSDKKPTTPKLK